MPHPASSQPPPVDSCAKCKRQDILFLGEESSADVTGRKYRYCGECMIGQTVKVFWPIDGEWYSGLVRDYNHSTGEHLLLYRDGESEWVRIGDIDSAMSSNNDAIKGIVQGGLGHGALLQQQGDSYMRTGALNMNPPPVSFPQRDGQRLVSQDRHYLTDMYNYMSTQAPPVSSRIAPTDDLMQNRALLGASASVRAAMDDLYVQALHRSPHPNHPSASNFPLTTQIPPAGHNLARIPIHQHPPPEQLIEFMPNHNVLTQMSRQVNSRQPIPIPNISTVESNYLPIMSSRMPPNVAPIPMAMQTLQGPPPRDVQPNLLIQRRPTPIRTPPSIPHMMMKQWSHPPQSRFNYPPQPVAPPSDGSNYNDTSLLQHYNNSFKVHKRKMGPSVWTKDEDKKLSLLVKSMGLPVKWSAIAQSMGGRSGKQCRERYVNHLNPVLKTAAWHPTEDATIYTLYNSLGPKWALMAKMIPGRTDNGIKNRFHNTRRQLESEDLHRKSVASATADLIEEVRLDRIRPFPTEFDSITMRLWDMTQTIEILAAQSVLATAKDPTDSESTLTHFGPFYQAEGEQCFRCGLFAPSVQCGEFICKRSRWCYACTQIPAHVQGNHLREILNLRRARDVDLRATIENMNHRNFTVNKS